MKKTVDDSKRLFKPDFLRTYIAMSKEYNPTISQELHEMLISKYIEKRQEQQSIKNKGDKYTTTRSLLALIRLCQARVNNLLFRLDSDFPTKSAKWMSWSALR
jgi:DNA replicative helicase MCM subunit Mcm2 (Cdc46/Mcm family)